MRNALPDALDLLTVSVEAGLGFDAAVEPGRAQHRRARSPRSSPGCSRRCRSAWDGRRPCGRWPSARRSPDLKSFCMAMVQADSLGIPIGRVLRIQSQEMRTKRRQRAEEKAQQVPVRIMIPLVLFILPCLFLVILGPAGIQIAEHVHGDLTWSMLRRPRRDRAGRRQPAVRHGGSPPPFRVFALALATGTVISERRSSRRPLPSSVVSALIAGVAAALEWGVADTSAPLASPSARPSLVARIWCRRPTRPGAASPTSQSRPWWPVSATAGHDRSTSPCCRRHRRRHRRRSADSSDCLRRAVAAAPPRGSLIGLGVGLLASWQSRSIRDLVARQAPYAAAHQLMARVHQLAERGRPRARQRLAGHRARRRHARRRPGAPGTTVFVVDADDTLRAAPRRATTPTRLADEIHLPDVRPHAGSGGRARCAAPSRRWATASWSACPRWTHELDERALEVADEFAVRLDTAVLFDDVRHARHGGGAQPDRPRDARRRRPGDRRPRLPRRRDRVGQRPGRRRASWRQRCATRSPASSPSSASRSSTCATRSPTTGSPPSLADYVREVSHGTDLRVHLVLDESGPPLSSAHATELLRVAQEAIGNVRKHAQRGQPLGHPRLRRRRACSLEVEDDGVGNAAPARAPLGPADHARTRRGHRRRPRPSTPRPGGGTVVTPAVTRDRTLTKERRP